MDLLKKLKEHVETAKNPLIVVLGPTASGKTALSIKLAQLYGGEIISTDSRQIYQEMPISTDAISPEERKGIPHHLLEVVKPNRVLTLSEYKDLAFQKIDDIFAGNNIPVLAGGTGLYLSAIIENYHLPHIPPNPKLREKLENELKEKGSEHLYKKLLKIDPGAAKKIHLHNVRYLIRALEINDFGQNKTDLKKKSQFSSFLLGIEWPRAELYQRVNLRVDNQLERGLVNEVKSLLDKGYQKELPSMSSLGIKEIIPYIKGQMSLEECIEILKRNTRRYAKRQMTWFRRYDNVSWLSPKELEKIIHA